MADRFSHLSPDGRAAMVDVADKPETRREATASAIVRMLPETFEKVREGQSKKGDLFRTAELAGIMGAKRTADLVPLCHPLPLSSVEVRVRPDPESLCLRIEATARTVGRTGVEMEAMTAASVAALTLYDMIKAVDRSAQVDALRLEAKSGGKSGEWKR